MSVEPTQGRSSDGLSDVFDVVANTTVRGAASQVSDLLLRTPDIEVFLQGVVDLAATNIGDGVSAAVTLERVGRSVSVVGSDTRAAQCDGRQSDQTDSPCRAAMRTNKVVVIDDLAQDDQFATCRPLASAFGVRSLLSLPLDGGEHAVGALNLYSEHAFAFGTREQRAAALFATEASRALHVMIRLVAHTELSSQLRAALNSRTVIDQAIGIVMGQNRCDADEAFAILRTASQNRNVKLRLVAAEIIFKVSHKLPREGKPFNMPLN